MYPCATEFSPCPPLAAHAKPMQSSAGLPAPPVTYSPTLGPSMNSSQPSSQMGLHSPKCKLDRVTTLSPPPHLKPSSNFQPHVDHISAPTPWCTKPFVVRDWLTSVLVTHMSLLPHLPAGPALLSLPLSCGALSRLRAFASSVPFAWNARMACSFRSAHYHRTTFGFSASCMMMITLIFSFARLFAYLPFSTRYSFRENTGLASVGTTKFPAACTVPGRGSTFSRCMWNE